MIKLEKITLDMLTEDSVSILRQEFDEEGNQVGDNMRCAYMNTKQSREVLQQKLPKDKYSELIEVWGDTPTVPTVDETVFEMPLLTIEEQKGALVFQMSSECNTIITNGFDMLLDDNKLHHFSLKTEDQLKIQALGLKAKSGETVLPYHADGEPCRFFSVQEILSLNTQMENIIEYQTTYFNSLRDYINSMTTNEELKSVKYGMEIPVEYQSEVLKQYWFSNNNIDRINSW